MAKPSRDSNNHNPGIEQFPYYCRDPRLSIWNIWHRSSLAVGWPSRPAARSTDRSLGLPPWVMPHPNHQRSRRCRRLPGSGPQQIPWEAAATKFSATIFVHRSGTAWATTLATNRARCWKTFCATAWATDQAMQPGNGLPTVLPWLLLAVLKQIWTPTTRLLGIKRHQYPELQTDKCSMACVLFCSAPSP